MCLFHTFSHMYSRNLPGATPCVITQRTEREADRRRQMSSIEKEFSKKEKCTTLLTKLLVLENLLIFHQNT